MRDPIKPENPVRSTIRSFLHMGEISVSVRFIRGYKACLLCMRAIILHGDAEYCVKSVPFPVYCYLIIGAVEEVVVGAVVGIKYIGEEVLGINDKDGLVISGNKSIIISLRMDD